MANDYNGYIASYREFMDHDHYRKALTGWGPHSADYYATRLSQLGHALKGDADAARTVDGQTDPAKADPAWAHMVAKEVADQAAEDAKVRAVGDVRGVRLALRARRSPGQAVYGHAGGDVPLRRARRVAQGQRGRPVHACVEPVHGAAVERDHRRGRADGRGRARHVPRRPDA